MGIVIVNQMYYFIYDVFFVNVGVLHVKTLTLYTNMLEYTTAYSLRQ